MWFWLTWGGRLEVVVGWGDMKTLLKLTMQDTMNNSTRGIKNLTFSSWNVCGLNNLVKRGKVLSHLKTLTSDIMFLQETHLNNNWHGRLRAKWIGEIYHSAFSSKARGGAVLIRRNVPFLPKKTIADKEGRYIIVIGEIHNSIQFNSIQFIYIAPYHNKCYLMTLYK